MRYSAEHKAQTRSKILDAAARRFRVEGYEGLGVDGLAKAAGVTNGAFYGHFATKADAYREIVAAGLDDLRAGIERFQAEHGADWVGPFAAFYFSAPKIDLAENACALPAFGPEIARAPDATRDDFATALEAVHRALVAGLAGDDTAARAWTMLGLMLGGVTLARGVPDAAQSRTLAQHFESALIMAARAAP